MQNTFTYMLFSNHGYFALSTCIFGSAWLERQKSFYKSSSAYSCFTSKFLIMLPFKKPNSRHTSYTLYEYVKLINNSLHSNASLEIRPNHQN